MTEQEQLKAALARYREGAIYQREWPEQAILYAGYSSKLPKIGARVSVLNLYGNDYTERIGTVIARDVSVREYTLTFQKEKRKGGKP